MMDLFVCSSNYQLLNAIMIVKNYNLEADLMITRESIWDGCNLEVLIREGVFKRVYKWTLLLEKLVDEKIYAPRDKVRLQIKKIITYLNKKGIWESLPNKQEQYKVVHIAYVDSITLWIYTYFKQNGAILSMFEDGTYSYGCFSTKKSLGRRICEQVLYRGSGIDECQQMYVKHPERILTGTHSDVKLLSISNSFDEQTIAKILLPLYKTNGSSINGFRRKVIVFDQNLELKEVKNIQKEIAEQTNQIFRSENVLVKLHPSSRDVEYGKNIVTFGEKIPFELVLAYENMNDKLLISIFSTACMSPKLDYDQEPYVIFTYKLFGDLVSISDNYLEQINQLHNSYSDKSRVIVPNDMNEFIQRVGSIKERMK